MHLLAKVEKVSLYQGFLFMASGYCLLWRSSEFRVGLSSLLPGLYKSLLFLGMSSEEGKKHIHSMKGILPLAEVMIVETWTATWDMPGMRSK